MSRLSRTGVVRIGQFPQGLLGWLSSVLRSPVRETLSSPLVRTAVAAGILAPPVGAASARHGARPLGVHPSAEALLSVAGAPYSRIVVRAARFAATDSSTVHVRLSPAPRRVPGESGGTPQLNPGDSGSRADSVVVTGEICGRPIGGRRPSQPAVAILSVPFDVARPAYDSGEAVPDEIAMRFNAVTLNFSAVRIVLDTATTFAGSRESQISPAGYHIVLLHPGVVRYAEGPW